MVTDRIAGRAVLRAAEGATGRAAGSVAAGAGLRAKDRAAGRMVVQVREGAGEGAY
ncbi:MAG: hypothetical protein ABIK43_05095 [candidate division WOR-3 bacterium]